MIGSESAGREKQNKAAQKAFLSVIVLYSFSVN